MSEFMEIEFKNILTKPEYEQLIKHFNLQPGNCFTQLNIYFDTKDNKLQKNKMALRTRILTNKIELTLKMPQLKGILETTDSINNEDLKKLLNEHQLIRGHVYQKLQSLNINEQFYEIARFETIRFEFSYLDNIIAIDKSVYYDHTDYEIELETKDYDYGKKVFTDLLESLNIKRNKPKNKIIRVLEYKKSLNNQRF